MRGPFAGRLALLAAAAGGLALARDAGAQTFGYNDRRLYESPQNFAVEVRGGAYYPNIDRTVGTATPYADFFGTSLRAQLGAEIDWQIVRIGPVLSLGVGAAVSYTNAYAQSPFSTSTLNPNPSTWGDRSATTSTLHILPTQILAVARFDGLARRYRFLPLVPYVKAGFAYSFWFVMNDTGIAHSSNGAEAYGGSAGFHVAAGLAFMLDLFEPGVARQWDSYAGINHSYLFGELHYTDLSGFGRRQFDVGALAWSVGIALEF